MPVPRLQHTGPTVPAREQSQLVTKNQNFLEESGLKALLQSPLALVHGDLAQRVDALRNSRPEVFFLRVAAPGKIRLNGFDNRFPGIVRLIAADTSGETQYVGTAVLIR